MIRFHLYFLSATFNVWMVLCIGTRWCPCHALLPVPQAEYVLGVIGYSCITLLMFKSNTGRDNRFTIVLVIIKIHGRRCC